MCISASYVFYAIVFHVDSEFCLLKKQMDWFRILNRGTFIIAHFRVKKYANCWKLEWIWKIQIRRKRNMKRPTRLHSTTIFLRFIFTRWGGGGGYGDRVPLHLVTRSLSCILCVSGSVCVWVWTAQWQFGDKTVTELPFGCFRKVSKLYFLFHDQYNILTRMHSSRMRTARSLPYGGVSLTENPLWTEWHTCVKTLPFSYFVCGR